MLVYSSINHVQFIFHPGLMSSEVALDKQMDEAVQLIQTMLCFLHLALCIHFGC